MAFELPAQQAPLDARVLIQDLEKPVRLKNAPATNILRKHIGAQYAWLMQHRPTWNDARVAYALADSNKCLLEGNAYARITENDEWSNRKNDFIPWTEVASGHNEAAELLRDQQKYNVIKPS